MTQKQINKAHNWLISITAGLLVLLVISNVWLFKHQYRVDLPEERAAMSKDKNHPDTTTSYFDTVENIYYIDYISFKK